jgi:benzylsuccinate CoA-transferase BbsF subunit
LDFCWVGAGALVTKLLAEHGAEVIKVESRARPDNLRVAPPFAPGVGGLDRSGYFASRNNDKRSFALNMREPKGQRLALELAARCDLVTNNFRPGVMERWGLGYEEVARVNPSVIYLAMSMQGADGPNSRYIGFGSTIAALGGLVHLSGRPNREPVGTGTHYPDHIPSPGHALVALLGAIRRRERTGEGMMIELSQLEATVNMLAPAVAAAAYGSPPERNGNRSSDACPSGVFRCRGEDEWCALAARGDEQWRGLVEALGDPALGHDPRFATHAGRKAHEDDLEAVISHLVHGRERHELARSLQEHGVPAWPVLSSADLLADEQLRARDFWRSMNHPVMGTILGPAAPFRSGDERTGPIQRAPLLGEHTRELARSMLALSDAEIDELTEAQVLW